MAAKIIVLSLLVSSAYGAFSFSYGVSDPNTGDVKDHHERRVGDNVVGKYSLLESDGTKRVVEYAANSATGFNAVVRKEPGAAGPAAAAALAHNAAITGTAPAIHPAPISPVGLAHSGLTAHLGGAFTHSRALGSVGPIGHAGAFAHGIANPHAHGNLGYPGYAPYSGAGYANPLAASLGAHGAAALGSYSHSIVHNVRPYGGPYASAYGGHGAYGRHGYGAAASGIINPAGLGSLAHGLTNPLANGWVSPLAKGANGWPSPIGNGVYGAAGLGAGLGW